MGHAQSATEKVCDFFQENPEIGEIALDAFNEADPFDLQPGDMAPIDEYLSYAKCFVKKWQKVPERKRMHPRMVTVVFACFTPGEFIGELHVYDSKGKSAGSVLRNPIVTPEDVRQIADLIWKKKTFEKLHLVK